MLTAFFGDAGVVGVAAGLRAKRFAQPRHCQVVQCRPLVLDCPLCLACACH